jgi:hypothetical protein
MKMFVSKAKRMERAILELLMFESAAFVSSSHEANLHLGCEMFECFSVCCA